MRQSALFTIVMIVLPFLAGQASAAIMHAAIAQYTDPFGTETRDAMFTDDSAGPITQPVAGSVNGSFGQITSALGPLGNLGMQAQASAAGSFFAQIRVENDFIHDPLGRSGNAVANFIIDGGAISFVAGNGSTLDFQIALFARIFESGGNLIDSRNFVTSIVMEIPPTGPLVPTVSYFGAAIGAGPGTLPFQVDIPLSAQSFNIGFVPANGYVSLEYLATFEADIVDFAEFVNFRFSDPLNVGGFGGAPTVAFAQVAEVDAPPALPLAAVGIAALGFAAHRRGRVRREPAATQAL